MAAGIARSQNEGSVFIGVSCIALLKCHQQWNNIVWHPVCNISGETTMASLCTPPTSTTGGHKERGYGKLLVIFVYGEGEGWRKMYSALYRVTMYCGALNLVILPPVLNCHQCAGTPCLRWWTTWGAWMPATTQRMWGSTETSGTSVMTTWSPAPPFRTSCRARGKCGLQEW